MSARPISEAKNPDLRGSFAAMHRAAALARKIAIQTNTCLVVVNDGQIVHITPGALRQATTKSNKTSA